MRRAAVSVLSNIAEGFESRTTAMFIDYLGPLKRQMITRKMEKLKRERARAG